MTTPTLVPPSQVATEDIIERNIKDERLLARLVYLASWSLLNSLEPEDITSLQSEQLDVERSIIKSLPPKDRLRVATRLCAYLCTHTTSR